MPLGADGEKVDDRRAVTALVAGLAGLALGLAAVIWQVVALAVVAGAAALVAGVSAFRLLNLVRSRDARIDELEHRVEELRHRAQRETEARETLETAFASRVYGTAVHRGELGENLTDPVTGLSSEAYFSVALDARVAAARRALRPVAVALIEVMAGLDDGAVRPADPSTVAGALSATLREADTACRLLDGGFALILEDTPETGAIWTVERVRRLLVAERPGLTLWAGIACYPAHGLEPAEVLVRAEAALELAREWRQDRIEVAATVDT